MQVLKGRNAQSILPEALYQIRTVGEHRSSRNGPVVKFPGPATILYERPAERVVFWGLRDCNPFFHLLESLWMLAGRNDVDYVARIVSTMANFSDDGVKFHGAYGHRWRRHFGFDQLDAAVQALSANSDDRRCVVQMWDSRVDLGAEGKDFPCNTQVVFSVNNGRLDMSVFNRSNDLVWGALGANAVHFSVLQEYIACRLSLPVGRYWQISNNMHLYLERHEGLMNALGDHAEEFYRFRSQGDDPYARGEVASFPLMSTAPEVWEEDLLEFMCNPDGLFKDPFFYGVAVPVFKAHQLFRETKGEERYELALEQLQFCLASDWKRACEEWILRRKANYLRAKDDGPRYD